MAFCQVTRSKAHSQFSDSNALKTGLGPDLRAWNILVLCWTLPEIWPIGLSWPPHFDLILQVKVQVMDTILTFVYLPHTKKSAFWHLELIWFRYTHRDVHARAPSHYSCNYKLGQTSPYSGESTVNSSLLIYYTYTHFCQWIMQTITKNNY